MRGLLRLDKHIFVLVLIVLFGPILFLSIVEVHRAIATCTQGNKYAAGRQIVSNVTGASGNITYEDGKLCYEGSPPPKAGSQAWVCVVKFFNDNKIWAQTGWSRYNRVDEPYVVVKKYAEISNGDDIDAVNASMNLTTHNYKCQLTDSTDGHWNYYLDNEYWWNFERNYWINETGNRVQFAGEIWNLEDDMPGINSDRCVFSTLKYYNGSWQNTNLTDNDVWSDDDTKWGVNRVSGTQFEIWDKSPLP